MMDMLGGWEAGRLECPKADIKIRRSLLRFL
jgi:hypothetical protein